MFKENFEKICFEKHISPSSVLEAIGLNRSTYSLWTEKSIPRKGTIQKLCDYLQVTEKELLGDSQEPAEQLTIEIKKEAPLELSDASDDENLKYLMNLFVKCDREGRERMVRDAEQILLDRLKGK